MKGYKDKQKKFHPIKNHTRKKRATSKEMMTPTGTVITHIDKHNEGLRLKRYAKEGRKGLTTALGSIISPPKRAPAVLLKEIKSDLDFRDQLIEKNKELKAEIKADPKSEFVEADKAEFKENAKEIQQLSKEIRSAFREIPKEQRKTLDRELINRLRLLR